MTTYCRPAKYRVQVGGKIEGDGSDGGDGDKNGKFRQFLKQQGALNPFLVRSRSLISFLGQLPNIRFLRPKDVLRT